jgi:hypothetical protein
LLVVSIRVLTLGWNKGADEGQVISIFAVILIVQPAFLFGTQQDESIGRSKGFIMTFINIMTSSTGSK